MEKPDLQITWRGPYSFVSDDEVVSVFSEPTNTPGLYLWTVKRGAEYLVNYVGISTKSITKRLQGHVEAFTSGKYWVYDPLRLMLGHKHPVYKSSDIQDFLKNYLTLAPTMYMTLRVFRLFVAELTVEKMVLERIESAIIRTLSRSEEAAHFLDNARPSRLVSDAVPILVEMHFPVQVVGLNWLLQA